MALLLHLKISNPHVHKRICLQLFHRRPVRRVPTEHLLDYLVEVVAVLHADAPHVRLMNLLREIKDVVGLERRPKLAELEEDAAEAPNVRFLVI